MYITCIHTYVHTFNMQGALPTPRLIVNPARLPVCHPTTPEQLTQASWALCSLPCY